MKKSYVTPAIELVEFNYSDQIIAKSGIDPKSQYPIGESNFCDHYGTSGCTSNTWGCTES